ncbi:MAG: DUF3192 domain-containing protein [Gemmatimonadota bacterium]
MLRRFHPRLTRSFGAEFIALPLLWAACASATSFRETNRQHLAELQVGMTRETVLDLMGVGQERQRIGSETQGPLGTGTDTLGVMSVRIPVGANAPILYNPHRSEIYSGDGSSWEVLYYYTDVARDDGMVTDDELTPLVLRDDVLEGWGWTYWAAQVRRYDLGAELPDPLPDPASTRR